MSDEHERRLRELATQHASLTERTELSAEGMRAGIAEEARFLEDLRSAVAAGTFPQRQLGQLETGAERRSEAAVADAIRLVELVVVALRGAAQVSEPRTWPTALDLHAHQATSVGELLRNAADAARLAGEAAAAQSM